jgi:protein-disulfide isomerase
MLEFSDFQCPFCSKFTKDVWPELKATFVDTGKVQLAFRHLPLPIHERAEPAAEATACAGEQKKFWPVHDRLFAAEGKFDDSDLRRFIAEAGVEPTQFATCLADRASAVVKQDIDTAKALKIRGTPSFLVGRRTQSGKVDVTEVLLGARPVGDFERAFGKASKG